MGERADERPETPLEPDGCGQVAGAGAKLPVAAGREQVGDTTTLEDYSVLAKLRESEEA